MEKTTKLAVAENKTEDEDVLLDIENSRKII